MTNDANRYDLRDGQRPVTFVGVLLASASSQSGSDVRWTELTLYRTTRGRYVLHKIGCSDVFHDVECSRAGKARRYETLGAARADKEIEEYETNEDAFAPCDVCTPLLDASPVKVERDISSVTTYESPDPLIRYLYRKNQSDGTTYLSRAARTLLDTAATADQRVRTAYNAPADIT